MDIWRYFEITHATHDVMNPSSVERIDELGEVVGLTAESRVLDIASGHGEMLIRWHERYGATGIGVDASPHAFARSEKRKAERVPDADIQLIHGRGEEYATDERFDVAVCLGASWIWKGFAGTLRALTEFAKPGGLIVSGEPYWKQPPPEEYLAVSPEDCESFTDLAGCRQIAMEQGLRLVWMAGSSLAQWDEYEMRQARAVDRFAQEHPDDPDLPELLAKRAEVDEHYTRWERDCLGWAIWVFRTPASVRT